LLHELPVYVRKSADLDEALFYVPESVKLDIG